MRSDVEIAESADLAPIQHIAERLGIPPEDLLLHGPHIAKLGPALLDRLADRPQGRLVLVTAVSPTPAGEGKTTTSVGLADGLHALGVRSAVALREPSMGPVFGMKGGAAGGGYSQVVPMTEINLHFTGDFAAIAAAHNLLAAVLDNHLHQGNELGVDPRTITWRRVLDVNDRALRRIVVGLGGATGGVPREDGFDIVVASELMAILCLADDLADLTARMERIVLAHTYDGRPVTVADLGVAGAMTVMLRQAMLPNLVQTLEGTPAFLHGGPFANIAHGCNSVIATRTALRLADVVVTEAGFGADLGAEKFIDLKCRLSGLSPDAAVVVATVRAMKYHGGVAVPDLAGEDLDALERGAANLRRHLRNLREVFGVPAVVSINRFPSDTDEEVALLQRIVADAGAQAHVGTYVVDGGAGATALAQGVLDVLERGEADVRYSYDDAGTVEDKARAVATRVYAAADVTFSAKARRQLAALERDGYAHLPICIAKTQYSFSTDATALGAPEGHVLDVREVRLSAGAGFVVLICGDVMTMPGLPKRPAAERIGLDADGRVVGLS